MFEALVAATVVVAPPPVLVTPPVATSAARSAWAGEARAEPVEIEVEVRLGADLLWSGPMRVAGNAGASFSRSKVDAPRAVCADETYYGGEGDNLNIQLRQDNFRQQPDSFNITVNYQRPAEDRTCGQRPGSRTIGLGQTVALPAGGAGSIGGDGGLLVRLRRR